LSQASTKPGFTELSPNMNVYMMWQLILLVIFHESRILKIR